MSARGRPTRPMPADFVQQYARHGWDARVECGWSLRQMKRWRAECGEDRLRLARLNHRKAEAWAAAQERKKGFRLN